MNSISKTLCNQKRIPLDIMTLALERMLRGENDEAYIEELLFAQFQSHDRARKTRSAIFGILERGPMTDYLMRHAPSLLAALKSPNDRSLILIALCCARYGFCYDIAVTMSNQFRVNETVSREMLDKRISAKYGLNKSVRNATDCAVPQMVEAGLLRRIKPGIYESVPPMSFQYAVTLDLWKESFFINEPLYNREEQDEILFEPYFKYIRG